MNQALVFVINTHSSKLTYVIILHITTSTTQHCMLCDADDQSSDVGFIWYWKDSKKLRIHVQQRSIYNSTFFWLYSYHLKVWWDILFNCCGFVLVLISQQVLNGCYINKSTPPRKLAPNPVLILRSINIHTYMHTLTCKHTHMQIINISSITALQIFCIKSVGMMKWVPLLFCVCKCHTHADKKEGRWHRIASPEGCHFWQGLDHNCFATWFLTF